MEQVQSHVEQGSESQFPFRMPTIPSTQTIQRICQNIEVVKNANRFIDGLCDRLQKEMPIKDVRFPDPFVSKEEVTSETLILIQQINEDFKEISGRQVSVEAPMDFTWKTILYTIISVFTEASEQINRKVEYNNLSSTGVNEELKKLRNYVPFDEIEYSRKFDVNIPLIFAFMITFILNEYRLSKSVVVYRGISRFTVKLEETQERLRESIETLGQLYKKIFQFDSPVKFIHSILENVDKYKEIRNKFSKKMMETYVNNIGGLKGNYPEIFTEEFMEETGGEAQKIIENESLVILTDVMAKVPELLTSISSERTKKFLEKLKSPGDRVTSIRFWSSSLDKAVALETFAGKVKEKGVPEECCLLEIEIPERARALFIGGKGHEAEVLINPCSVFELVKFDKKKNEMKLRYVGNKYPKNVEADWKLFKEVIKQYFMNVSKVFVYGKGEPFHALRDEFIILDPVLRMKMNKYLQCVKK